MFFHFCVFLHISIIKALSSKTSGSVVWARLVGMETWDWRGWGCIWQLFYWHCSNRNCGSVWCLQKWISLPWGSYGILGAWQKDTYPSEPCKRCINSSEYPRSPKASSAWLGHTPGDLWGSRGAVLPRLKESQGPGVSCMWAARRMSQCPSIPSLGMHAISMMMYIFQLFCLSRRLQQNIFKT